MDDPRIDPRKDRAAQAAVHLDPRLADLWTVLWEEETGSVDVAVVAAMLRLAYLSGYNDALAEPRGALFETLGLAVPPLRSSRGAPRRSAPAWPGSSGT